MNHFQLFLDTELPELFSKATCELGTIFYRILNEHDYEIVYFSGSRIARFRGVPDEQIIKLVEMCGFEVDLIDLDENAGTVKIIQKKAGET